MTHATPTDTLAEATDHPKRPYLPHLIRLLSIPIVVFWVFVAIVVNVIAPPLEVVGEAHSAPMAPEDAPSMTAMKLMGGNFHEFNSNSTVMIVLEAQQTPGSRCPCLLQRDHPETQARPRPTSNTSRTSGATP